MLKKAVIGLVFLLLLTVFAVGGGYYYYQYKAKQLISVLIEQLSPLAAIKFSTYDVDFQGNLKIFRIQVAPVGYRNVVSIDQLDIRIGSALAIFSADDWFKGSLPSNLNLQFNDLIFSLDADFLRAKNRSLSGGQEEQVLWGLACAKEKTFLALAEQLGLTKLEIDAQVKISSDASNKVLRMSIAASVPELAKGFFEFELNNNVTFDFYDRAVLSQAKVSHALLSVTDVGFNLKRLKYCAKQEVISKVDYPKYFKASVLLKMLGDTEVQELELDNSILALFEPRANIVMRLTPKEALYLPDVFSVRFDALKSKDLSVTVNTKKASTRYLSLLRGSKITILEPDDEVNKQAFLENIKEQMIKKINRAPRYRVVSVEELAGFEGTEIRLRTKLGKEIDGVLLEMLADKIMMQRRVEQGMVTYPVLIEDIATVKVFR
ncbi:MAG: hypothetical protein OFPII_37890 [Osedax symbiont Rs1]|nr:MAG: hypothetical protein OFPII_37890 [Osedax symbiont Rs1]